MVSIPDWARFAQIADTKQQDTNALMNKFYKQREADAVRQAEKSGYFLNPTEDALRTYCENLNNCGKDIANFRLVRLSGLHLRVLGDVGFCSRLTVCLLNNNFLSKMDSLIACRHLIKLDLHSNQLSAIPGSAFWSSLRKLQALHLHDNPLGKFETLQILGSSPALTILTLYDTPLSLKINYRHHVVNSIWTLKALDKYVISDEEIIEDAVFSVRFSALTAPFRIELCPHTPQNTTFEQEMAVLKAVNSKINTILAGHSPVLIVQRSLRGYLTRRRLGVAKKVSPLTLTFPPPGTPIVVGDHARTTFPSQAMDFDTYMLNRRPGSIVPEEALAQVMKDAQAEMAQMQDPKSSRSLQGQRLHVNLEKLELGTLSGLNADTAAMEHVMATSEYMGLVSSAKRDKRYRRDIYKEDEKPIMTRIKDQRQFFGPVVTTAQHDGENVDDDDEIPIVDFRIKGSKPKLLVSDATTEMILMRKESGQMVRDAENERVKREAQKTAPKVTPHNFTTTEQRIFNRAHGTMGLSCLLAVHKAYREREKAERAAAKMENILGMREERQRAKDRINLYHDERRAQVLKARDMDRARVIDQMEKHELKRLNFLDKQQEIKVRFSEGNKNLKAENSFMQEFNSQHTSVSNALLRHDRQAKMEDTKSVKLGKVSNMKTSELEQQDLVKKYMEHRQVMRQTETSMAKAALDTKMLSEANERIMDARNRVAHMKARRASVQAFYTLPTNTMSPTATAPAGMSRWEAQSTVSGGRLGRHHTVLT